MTDILTNRPVDGHPFRAHLRHVSDASGVPWQALVLAAGVPLALGRRLMATDPGLQAPLPAAAAARLLDLNPASARALSATWVPSKAATERARDLLRGGWTPVRLARGLGLTGPQLRALVAGGPGHVTRLVDLQVAALASGPSASGRARVRAA